MRISKITLSFGLLVVLSASFARPLFFYLFKKFGRNQTEIALGLFFLLLSYLATIYIFKQTLPAYRKLFFFLLFILGLILTLKIPIFAERIHVLEYGLLGWLAMNDNIKGDIKLRFIVSSLLIVLFFGALDEEFQFFLPQRVSDLKDVLLDFLSGGWGVALFLLKKQ